MALPHKEPVWVAPHFLAQCGFLERFQELMDGCGWPELLTLCSEADVDDTCEFLTSFHYVGPREYEGFTYTFRGEQRQCSMTRLRQIFGWPEVGEAAYIAFANDRDRAETCRVLTNSDRYRPSGTTARAFRDPFWYYIHFVLTRTLTARANGNDKPSLRDYALLGALIRGVVPHWGHFLCKHWSHIQPRGPVCVGGMVTYVLRRLHPDIDALPGHRILQCGYADDVRVMSGRAFRYSSEGEVRWTYFADPELQPPPSPPRRRGRPPLGAGRGRGRRDQRDEMEAPVDIVPPEDQLPRQPGDFSQEQIDYLFNVNRAMMMAMDRGYHPVPAPPGWRPGQAIPPQYMQFPPPPPDY